MTIFIVGYMASGKTTFGRALARETGMNFIDLDFYIEQRFHSSVKELFAKKGENEFRRIEANLLREAGEFDDTVVSCGGGTPCYSDNMEYMNSRGVTVCLQAAEEVIARRIKQAGDKRPLMAGKSLEEIVEATRQHMKVRKPFYDRAQIIISGDELEDKRQISETVKSFLENYLRKKE